MHKFFKRLKPTESPSSQSSDPDQFLHNVNSRIVAELPEHVEAELNQNELESDPGLRKPISSISDSKERERIRRAYCLKGPCQPRLQDYPKTQFGEIKRKFTKGWFDEYSNWLEYSISKDAVFCLCCYLFKPDYGNQGGGEVFVSVGFSNWKKKDKLDIHVGDHTSIHNKCLKACEDLMKQKKHIDIAFLGISDQAKIAYRIRLKSSVRCIRYLLRQGLAFRGHDESEESVNQENFLELLHFLAESNDDIKAVVLQNAPDNHKLIAPSIQKDIVHAAACLTTQVTIDDIRGEFFSVLVDEARDVSCKEQMAIALRYVDKNGFVIERFVGVVHVNDTSALSLKKAIESFFSTHGLSMSNLRGQGYDGASNMRGEFNGLKSLILAQNGSAFYVHCFAHQLQLTLVTVAKKHQSVEDFFSYLAILTNVVGASCKRRDIFREKQLEKVIEGISSGDIMTGRGLNQETGLKRAGDTRWGSHFGTVTSVIRNFSSVINVLEIVEKDGTHAHQKLEAKILLRDVQCFEFVFLLHLLQSVMGITNDLSLTLQKKDQDIVGAMTLVRISKIRLQKMRDGGWENLLKEVHEFCINNEIEILKMEDVHQVQGKSRRKAEKHTNLHHFRVELFYTVIDTQLQELNSRFNEANTELLLCMACLDPRDSFSMFDKVKLIRLAKFYPSEYSLKLVDLDHQLENYIMDVSSSDEFFEVKGIGELAQKLVELKKDTLYPLVYMLIKLVLILPVATATVERAFSAMKIVKSSLRNRIGDVWMNDCLVPYIEKENFNSVDDEAIMKYFQDMKKRKMLL